MICLESGFLRVLEVCGFVLWLWWGWIGWRGVFWVVTESLIGRIERGVEGSGVGEVDITRV